jgi:hypothetical protein
VREVRFRWALLLAVCGHAGVAATLELAPRAAPAAIAAGHADDLIAVSIEPPAPSTALPDMPRPTPSTEKELAPAHAPPPDPGLEARAAATAVNHEPAVEEPSAHPEPAKSAEPWSFPAARPIDLDVGSYWKRVATEGSAAAPGSDHPPTNEGISSALRQALADRDRDIGLGRSGPLISAAHDAASSRIAPDVGSATLEIDSDPEGRIVATRVLAADDVTAWSGVAREIARVMSAKRVRVPPGARGVRARLRIVIERALPSGDKVATHAGALPDDVPGSDPVCTGEGAARRCTAGMPLGTSVTGADVANLGAKASRIVRVLALGEEIL